MSTYGRTYRVWHVPLNHDVNYSRQLEKLLLLFDKMVSSLTMYNIDTVLKEQITFLNNHGWYIAGSEYTEIREALSDLMDNLVKLDYIFIR